MREILLIWSAKLIGIKNTFLRGQGKRGRRGYLAVLAVLALGFFVYYGSSYFLDLVRRNLAGLPGQEEVWRVLCLNLATSLALASFLFLFMTSLGTVMGNFLEGGLEFLLSQPLRTKSVFAAKFGESLVSVMLGLAPIILPAWIALGVANGAGIAFYLTIALTFILGGVLFLGPVAVLILLVMRYISKQRVRQAVVSLSLLFGLVIVFSTQFLNAMAARGLGSRDWLASLATWSVAKVSYLPHAWLARAPLATLGWPGLSLAGTLLPLAAAAGIIYLAASYLAERIFLAGWSAAQAEVPDKRRGTEASPVRSERSWTGSRGGPLMGFLRKDFILAGREPLIWYNLLVAIIVMGFFIWNITSTGGGNNGTSNWLGILYAALIVLCTIGWNSQIGGIAVSREGASWWLVQASPGRPENILAAKFVFALLPQLVFVILANSIIALMSILPGFHFLQSLLIGIVLSAGVTGLTLLLDVLAPNFEIKLGGRWSGGKNVGGGKVTLTALLSMLFVALTAFSLALPVYYRALHFDWMTGDIAQIAGLAVFALEVTVVLVLFWTIGNARMRRLLGEAG